MSERVPMVCDSCGRNLWVSLRNIGRIGKCKYCGFVFQARMCEGLDLTPPSLPRTAEAADEGFGAKTLSSTSGRLRIVGEPPASDREPGPGTSDALEHAPSSDRSTHKECRWEAGHPPISEPRTELAALHDRNIQEDQLKERVQSELAEIELIRARLQETHAQLGELGVRADLDMVREIEALRGECHRLREETQALRSQMEVQSAAERARSADLTRQYEQSCADRERLEMEVTSLTRDGELTRNLLGAEREALVHELDALQSRLEILERAQDEAEYEHHQARNAWEEERRELEASSERRRRELLEAEQRCSELLARLEAEAHAREEQRAEHERRIAEAEAGWEAEREGLRAEEERRRRELDEVAEQRLAELRARFDAERQLWDQQCDEHAQLAALWETLAQEVEQAQADLVAGRDALGREVQELRAQLKNAEIARTEAAAQFDESRARWEAEGRAREEQRAEYERRIAETEARLAEAEQLQGRTARERDDRADEAGRLAGQLAALERSRAEAEAGWEAEREGLRAEEERRRRELDEVAERRMAELRARFQQAVRERDQLLGRIAEVESRRREAERSGRVESDRLIAVLEQVRRESMAIAQRGAEHAEEARAARAELERHRADDRAHDEENERRLVTLRRAWEVERRRWCELLAAAHHGAVPGGPANSDSARTAATRPQDGMTLGIGPIVSTVEGRGEAAAPLRARPQSCSYRDRETFRSHLEKWIEEAQANLQGMYAPPGRSASEGWVSWLEYEIRTAREEIELLGHPDGPGAQPAAHLELPC